MQIELDEKFMATMDNAKKEAKDKLKKLGKVLKNKMNDAIKVREVKKSAAKLQEMLMLQRETAQKDRYMKGVRARLDYAFMTKMEDVKR